MFYLSVILLGGSFVFYWNIGPRFRGRLEISMFLNFAHRLKEVIDPTAPLRDWKIAANCIFRRPLFFFFLQLSKLHAIF